MIRTALTATKALREERRQACLDAAQWWFANLRDPEAWYFMARLVAAVGAKFQALVERSKVRYQDAIGAFVDAGGPQLLEVRITP